MYTYIQLCINSSSLAYNVGLLADMIHSYQMSSSLNGEVCQRQAEVYPLKETKP